MDTGLRNFGTGSNIPYLRSLFSLEVFFFKNIHRYVEFLAHGGYGWVSLVYDESEKRPLAIKCTTDTSEMELTWWPKLEHDTVLPLIEYITLDSCTVFIMPAMRKDLWMCINEPQFYQDELSFGLCRIWLGDVATALNYLHSQHLCHLDLKLDNVFLKENGRVCLGDFSLLSDTRQVPAKFHFLELYEPPEYTDWCHSSPPEAIAEGVHKEGDKADMWQFGILSLDLLTNLKLSDGQSSQFVLWHHDVWPFIQKVLLHKEYLQFLMEDAFKNVLFNDLDFDLSHEFLQDILVLEPGLRISASDAMKHDFVTIQWPQVPSTFGMPKQIAEHPSKPRAKKKMKPATGEGEVERVGAPLEEAISKRNTCFIIFFIFSFKLYWQRLN
ncbi:protein kinase domain-containing protein [Trichonephila clavata]|uniref:Protein kinase domain-containing protein n=1 Tax=Trichonephila clavata TaxID=2740835 RepID=A0A8X6JBQ6_TRICU|nr:protein kinase domain-containing protein [Trichonephila clavata]